MEYGLRRTFSVNCPPSSYPTYPGGAPTRRETVNFSIYSLISIRINASEEPNMYFASSLAKWVLPTPVGPKNIKVPIGLLGSFSPTRLRNIAFTNFSIAVSWAITLDWRDSFIPANLMPSACAMRCTGIPDIIETTFAISSASTVCLLSFNCSSHACFIRSSSTVSSFSLSRKLAASSKFCDFTASFFLLFASSISFSCSSISFGTLILVRCTREPASSRASIALSGKLRSVI